MRERLQRVVEGCTVHHTLTHPPQIRVALSADQAGAMTCGPGSRGGGP